MKIGHFSNKRNKGLYCGTCVAFVKITLATQQKYEILFLKEMIDK